MFEKATRLKLRFNFRGLIGVEELWDLDEKQLNSIFKELNAKLKSQSEESLLDQKTDEDKILELKVSIIRYIVKVKLEERKNRENEALKEANKQKILNIIAKKQDEALENKSIDELMKLVGDL